MTSAEKKHKYSSYLLRYNNVLVISGAIIIFYLLMLFIKLSFSIYPGSYHVDERTYLSGLYTCSLFDIKNIFGNLYYCIVEVFNYDIYILLLVQFLMYFITSVYLYIKVFPFLSSRFGHLALIIFVFDPYRLHLSMHILKETWIIFGFVFFSVSFILSFAAVSLLRSYAFIYFLAFARFKFYVILIFISSISLILMDSGLISYWLDGGHEDMIFREFDKVPTFNSYGLWGDFLRALIWPFFVFSGLFLFASPSLFFVPIAISTVTMTFVLFSLNIERHRILIFYSIFSILAFLVPGFTSFLRYCYPLVVIFPLIAVSSNGYRINIKNFKE